MPVFLRSVQLAPHMLFHCTASPFGAFRDVSPLKSKTFRPKWAQIKITANTDDRLQLDYFPLVFLLLPLAFGLICLFIALREWSAGEIARGSIAFAAGCLPALLFAAIFFRRVRLVMTRRTGDIVHSKTVFFRKSQKTYPLASFTGAKVDESIMGDTAIFRTRLTFSDREDVPLTRAFMSTDTCKKAAEAINSWHEPNS